MFLVTYLIDLYVNMYDVKTYTVPYTVPLERRYLTYIRQKTDLYMYTSRSH